MPVHVRKHSPGEWKVEGQGVASRLIARPEMVRSPFARVAGEVCLDLVNTIYWRGDPARREDRLPDYIALVAWSVQVGDVDETHVAALVEEAARRPRAARDVLERAWRLREAIAAVCQWTRQRSGGGAASRSAAGATPFAEATVDVLNAEIAVAAARRRLLPPDARSTPDEPRWRWEWDAGPVALDRPLWAVAQSAETLLVSGAYGYVRWCANEACGWVFLDLTKNHSRRWCDMRLCGNRAKAHRHAQRHRQSRQ